MVTNVKITDEDVVEKFSLMEDPAWAKLSAERDYANTIRSALIYFKEAQALKRMGVQEVNDVRYTIYGPDNKYFVKEDGTIWISVHNIAGGSEQKLSVMTKAESLGFGIFW